MRKYLLLSSAILLAGCNAHIGYGDIATALRGNGLHRSQTVTRNASREECAVHATRRAADRAESAARQLRAQMESANRALEKNRAWDGRQCVQVSMRDVPPRPESLSDNEIAYQAIGSCMDTVMRRAPMVDVLQAFASVRKEDYLKIGAAWGKGHKEECANVQSSQMDDWITRMCGAFGPEGMWACMQTRVDNCIQQIVQSCRASLSAWEQEVTEIKAEPEKLVRSCEQSLRDIDEANRELPNAEITARLNRDEYNRIARSGRIVPSSACPME